MKKLSFIILLSVSFSAQSQVWIAQNAIWHYDFQFIGDLGYYTYEYTGDSLVSGQMCQVIEHKKHNFGHTPPPDYQLVYGNTQTVGHYYTYVSGDTVFYENNGEFFILVDFGANIGDSWIISTTNSGMMCNDTSRVEVVDTGSVIINSSSYRTVTLETIQGSSYGLSGLYVERFGLINTNTTSQLFPLQLNCDTMTIVEYYQVTFKCFEDDLFTLYNPSQEDCDWPKNYASIVEGQVSLINVFPNPVDEILQIDLPPTVNQLHIYNSSGQQIMTMEVSSNSFVDASQLQAGTYFIQAIKDSGEIIRSEFIKN